MFKPHLGESHAVTEETLLLNACLSIHLLLLSLFLGCPQTGLQLLQLSLSIAQQHLQGAVAGLHSAMCPSACWSHEAQTVYSLFEGAFLSVSLCDF